MDTAARELSLALDLDYVLEVLSDDEGHVGDITVGDVQREVEEMRKVLAAIDADADHPDWQVIADVKGAIETGDRESVVEFVDWRGVVPAEVRTGFGGGFVTVVSTPTPIRKILTPTTRVARSPGRQRQRRRERRSRRGPPRQHKDDPDPDGAAPVRRSRPPAGSGEPRPAPGDVTRGGRVVTRTCTDGHAGIPAVRCGRCGDEITGTVFVLGRDRARCEGCLGEHRTERPTACASCGRPLVVVDADARFKHDVCSVECGQERRRRLRRVEHAQRMCAAPGCDRVFTPTRSTHRFCSGACRVRALRKGTA